MHPSQGHTQGQPHYMTIFNKSKRNRKNTGSINHRGLVNKKVIFPPGMCSSHMRGCLGSFQGRVCVLLITRIWKGKHGDSRWCWTLSPRQEDSSQATESERACASMCVRELHLHTAFMMML